MAALNELIYLAGIQAVEEAEMFVPERRFHRRILDPFESLSDHDFIKLYRLSKPLVQRVIEIVEPYLIAPTTIARLTATEKVLITLRFFAAGSYQLDVGANINHNVAQASVSKAIRDVTDVLNLPNIFNNYVHMPRNLNELQVLRNGFYHNYQFPGLVGCVDCTHVAIYPPQIQDAIYPEQAYVNRKGYHSINVQLICDYNLKIMNVCARYPGSCHDSYIWSNSAAFQYIHNLYANGHRGFYLLGDSGYALRPWMLTPIVNAQANTPEENYNTRHRSTRSLIERCNGLLKMRFRCLLKHRVLHYAPNRASKIINSCTILHNLCLEDNIPLIDEEEGNVENVDLGIYNIMYEVPEQFAQNAELLAGRQVRQLLLQNHFQN